VVDFVEIRNVHVGKMIIKAAKKIFNSDKICCSYSDMNFGITFFGTQCIMLMTSSVHVREPPRLGELIHDIIRQPRAPSVRLAQACSLIYDLYITHRPDTLQLYGLHIQRRTLPKSRVCSTSQLAGLCANGIVQAMLQRCWNLLNGQV